MNEWMSNKLALCILFTKHLLKDTHTNINTHTFNTKIVYIRYNYYPQCTDKIPETLAQSLVGNFLTQW